MKKIIVTSKNPNKISATRKAFKKIFPKERVFIESVSVPSGISDQPMTDRETFKGAKNRAVNAYKMFKDADFWVGIEGGLDKHEQDFVAFGWIYIIWDKNKGFARTNAYLIPRRVTSLVKKGIELGTAADIVFKKNNSKQQNGVIGLLTKNFLTRETLFVPAIILALLPYTQEELYKS